MLLAQNHAIWIVVHYHDIMILGKLHQSLICGALGTTSCRHIGIVGPHQFYFREIHLLQLIEVGLPTVVLTQIIIHNLCAKNLAQRCICWVARIRHQHLFAWIHKGQRYMQNTLFRTNQWQHFALAVYIYAIPALVESSHRFAQFGYTHCQLISVSVRTLSHLTEFIDGLGRWWHIRTTDSQTYNILALGIHLCHLFKFFAEVVLLY